jgi:hypothetical protein
MAYNPDDPYGIGDLYNGNFNVDPSFFTSEPVRMREHAASNLAKPLGGTPYVPASSGDGNARKVDRGGDSPAPASTPPPAPTPPPAATTYAVKQPSPSLVTYNAETLPQELIVDLLFEDVGGTELINVSRHDTINGQNVVYSLISNLSILNKSFNPNNILAGQISYSQFSQYSLDIASKLMGISLDSSENLVIEFSSIGNDEYAEVELSSDGTIYRIGVVIP